MVEMHAPERVAPLTVDDYLTRAQGRRRGFLIGGILLSILCACSFVAMGKDNIAIPLTLLLCLVTPIILWNFPRIVLPVTLVAVCLFELEETGTLGPFTGKIPFFWDVNTIFQRYANMQNFHAIPLNLFEVIILIAGICSLFRAVFSGTVSLKGGALFVPILVYIGFVLIGWGVGLASGGDFKISLQEVRSQVYFLLAYLMAVNMVDRPRDVVGLLWITAICIGFKGILYTFVRYVNYHGMPVPDQGVGSHEEAFFFDAFAVLLATLVLCGAHKKLQYVMWALLPFVILGNLATNRRAATAALVVIIPLMMLSAYRALPNRRRLVVVATLVLAIGGGIYYQAFKNSSSMLGEPARAVKSEFQPDARDSSSDAYRVAENKDLMATIQSAPLGYGYGKRMLHAVPIADISSEYEWWDIMTHNQILWVWMRTGTEGFLAFWIMISAIIIKAGQVIREDGVDSTVKAVGIFAMTTVGMLMIFGLLDLQLSNFRDMLFAGFWSGILVAPALAAHAPNRKAIP